MELLVAVILSDVPPEVSYERDVTDAVDDSG
jgi:hypothetical protein